MTAVWVTSKSCTRWLLTVLYAALVPMLAIASTTLANAHVHSGWFRRTRTACGRSEESQRPSQHLLPQAYERTARCRWWSKTVHSSAMAVAPRDGRQHHDVALARRHARAPQGADGAAEPSALRPWQSHGSDVSATRSTRSHTCNQALLAKFVFFGAGRHSGLRPHQAHSTDISETRSTLSHTCDRPFLARAKRSNLARGGARAMVA